MDYNVACLVVVGVSVQMAKDHEVDRLLSAMSGRSGMGVPTPMMWPPEPQSAGPWGGPPFNPGGMMGDPMGPGMMHPDSFLPPGADHGVGF